MIKNLFTKKKDINNFSILYKDWKKEVLFEWLSASKKSVLNYWHYERRLLKSMQKKKDSFVQEKGKSCQSRYKPLSPLEK